MSLESKIKELVDLKSNSDDNSFVISLDFLLKLLIEINNSTFETSIKNQIIERILPKVNNIKNSKEARLTFREISKILMKEFQIFPSNYFTSFATVIGLSLGAGIGFAYGSVYEINTNYGLMIGPGIGLIFGVMIGRLLDKSKAEKNKTLKNL